MSLKYMYNSSILISLKYMYNSSILLSLKYMYNRKTQSLAPSHLSDLLQYSSPPWQHQPVFEHEEAQDCL